MPDDGRRAGTKGKSMKKLACLAAFAAVAFCMSGCSKEEPSALDQLKKNASEAGKAAGNELRQGENAAKELAKDLDTELD